MINKKAQIFLVSVLLMASASGCDLINAVKEYFKKPVEAPISKPAVTPQKQLVAQKQDEAKEEIKNKEKIKVKEAPLAENVLAKVGDWTITIEEFNYRLQTLKEEASEYDTDDIQVKQMLLEELVNQQMLVLEAETTGVTKEKDVAAAIEEMRRIIIVREMAQRIVKEITVSDEEVVAFYEEKKELLKSPIEWHVREIVLPTKEEATNLLAEILKGADFSLMAQQHSKGKTAADGGDLGFIIEEPFAQMGQALLPLKEGDVSSVFEGPEGHYIVKLEEKGGGEEFSLEEIKDEIIQTQTMLKQQQAILEYLQKIKEKTNIIIKDDLLK